MLILSMDLEECEASVAKQIVNCSPFLGYWQKQNLCNNIDKVSLLRKLIHIFNL